MRPIKLVVVSTNALTHRGVSQMIANSNSPIEIVGAFTSFQAMHHYVSGNVVDVILVDDALPPLVNLLQEVKFLSREYVGVSLVVILQRPVASLVQRLLEYGVRGILHKNDDLEQYLVQAIVWGKQRALHLSPGISRLVDIQRKPPVALSQRDFDVLKLLTEGLDPKEITSHLGISGNTVYRVLRRLRDTFNVQNNAQLIIHYRTDKVE